MRVASRGQGTLQWTLAAVAAATGGRVVGDATRVIDSLSTDSRTVTGGDLFVAIAGEHHDGHDFAGAAAAAGAAAVLVARSAACRIVPRIEVEDPLSALRDLAVARRQELEIPVVAVTGSTGKTTTKDLLAAGLPGAHASPRSYNNEIGVPLTILGCPPDAAYLVVEVGSRGTGHIAHLAPAVRPHVAIITNLGVVHMETFGTPAALAAAKWELIAALDSTGTAVLPHGESRLRRPTPATVVTFGEDPGADVAVDTVRLDTSGRPTFRLDTPAGGATARLGMAGRHQVRNAAAAVAAGLALGVPLSTLVAGMERATGSPWRMEIHPGWFTVVNDSYNANPDSVEGALRTVAAMPGRPVAILGEMAELGPVAVEEHVRVGRLVAELGFAALIVVGSDPGLAAGFGPEAVSVTAPDDVPAVARRLIRERDVVLVKASRAVGLDALADELAATAAERGGAG